MSSTLRPPGDSIAGFPLEQIRAFVDVARPIDRKVQEIFELGDTLPLKAELATQLVNLGWNKTQPEAATGQGARYSPRRTRYYSHPSLRIRSTSRLLAGRRQLDPTSSVSDTR